MTNISLLLDLRRRDEMEKGSRRILAAERSGGVRDAALIIESRSPLGLLQAMPCEHVCSPPRCQILAEYAFDTEGNCALTPDEFIAMYRGASTKFKDGPR